MSLFDLQDVCMVIGSLATLDLPMVVDLIGIYVLKGPYCTLTMTNWFLQALSVIPRGSWGDVARRFTMIRWASLLVQADEGVVFSVVDLIKEDLPPPTLKSQIPCESGWSQAPRRQQDPGNYLAQFIADSNIHLLFLSASCSRASSSQQPHGRLQYSKILKKSAMSYLTPITAKDLNSVALLPQHAQATSSRITVRILTYRALTTAQDRPIYAVRISQKQSKDRSTNGIYTAQTRWESNQPTLNTQRKAHVCDVLVSTQLTQEYPKSKARTYGYSSGKSSACFLQPSLSTKPAEVPSAEDEKADADPVKHHRKNPAATG
ncbi:hypothetical protein F511_38722 [Dorcoceras hygrometricum]|uniref:Uncharacterized protein n=1 Tax=Dorcoceras hygrometricum TaxID=472368 RepID=A0A2Z7CI83_9LAMI|nr:hypothetical protein F511_38722 [Dorcoceras hygrometricum]